MTIQEVCRAKKAALGMTAQDIADVSGLSVSSINNFFAHASKSPALYTTGHICAALGISLDEFFGIGDRHTATEKTLQAEKIGLENHLTSKRETIDMQNRTMDLMERGLRLRNRAIVVLAVIVILLLIWSVYIDMHCLDIGFWRG